MVRKDNLKDYINLYDRSETLFDDCDIDFAQKFDKISVSHCEDIKRRWNKGGFQLCFKKSSLWIRKRNPTFTNRIEITTKKGEKINTLLDDYHQYSSQRFIEIKIQKKTQRWIGYSIDWNCWLDLTTFLDKHNQFYCHAWNYKVEFSQYFTGYITKYRDGNNSNLNHQNLVILPKGISLNQLYKRTNPQPKFCIYPEIETKLKNSSFREAINIMVYCNDKIWLNHNIVCVVLDKFVETYRKDDNKTHKEAYILLNMYAKKFGYLPVLDRLVLTFWKFDIDCFHKNLLSLHIQNEEVQKICPKNGIIRI